MATVEFRYDPKDTAWFTANAAMVLAAGEPAYHSTTGLFKLGDGVTALSALSFLPTITSVLTIGTTPITSGTNTNILYNNNGVLGEYTVTGTGTEAVLSTSPTFVTDITTPLINGVGGILQLSNADQTGLTAATEFISYKINGVSNTWNTGNYATQRFFHITASTPNYVSVSTIDNMYNLFVDGLNTGTNANVSFRYALGLGGNLEVASVSGSSEIYLNKSSTTLRIRNTGTGFSMIGTTLNNFSIGTNNASYITMHTTFGVQFADAINLTFNTGTGSQIATGTTQKLAFWGATPIVRPTTAIAAATFVTNTSLIANDTATFDGYTVGQVVKALRNVGILA